MWVFQWTKRNFKIVIGFSFNFMSQCQLFVNNSHTDQQTPRRVSGSCFYRTLGTRGFIFSCCETLEPTSPDCQPSNADGLILQQFAFSLSAFFFHRFLQLYLGSISAPFLSPVYIPPRESAGRVSGKACL